ncbi:MAG: glycosyltransferase [Gammaproteobacteria bacterium]|nr:glycosyltransferase [Gammaproteobacteria bacterium]
MADTGRPLRILHLIDSGGLYGAERMLLTLGAACRGRGHAVTVGTIVAPADAGDPLGEAAMSQGLGHVRFAMPDGFRIAGIRDILHYVRAQRIDVLHTHGYRANILMACVPRRRRPCPVVATLHGWTAVGRRTRVAAYEALERCLSRRLDAVVVVSEAMRARLPRTCREAVVWIPNGVELPAGEDRHGRGDARAVVDALPVVLGVGRLGTEKGFDVLLDALAGLAGQGLGFRLVIAGDGAEGPRLRAQAEALGLAQQTQFAGYVADVRPLYRTADVLVIPSRSEGLPLVLLEALGAGVPVVATRVGEIPAVLGDGAFGELVTPGSATDLAAALRRVLLDREAAGRRADAARDRVASLYSAQAMAQRYLTIYQEVIG